MKPSLLILAAGSGSRYDGLKQLDSLGPHGETILDYSISDALQAGFGKVVLVIRKDFQKDFEEKIVSRWKGKAEIVFAYQEVNPVFQGLQVAKREKPWGVVHAVLSAKGKIHEPFAVVNADDFYGKNAFKQMADFLLSKCAANFYGLVVYPLGRTLSDYGAVSRGVCETSAAHTLTAICEFKNVKKTHGGITGVFNGQTKPLAPEACVSMNFWGLHPSFFDHAQKIFLEFVKQNASNPQAEMTLPDVIGILIGQGVVRVSVLPCSEEWFGVTYPEDRPDVIGKLQQINKSPNNEF
ncbi:MAG: nucleotidyltransferase [Chitinophagales bacterium]|nr:MAG: nucleotidyltransferase [Chitinophagales bacterium]